MMQNKWSSLVESITNTAIGFVITILFSPLVYTTCGVSISNWQITGATILFTVLSIVRNYVVRRIFNINKKIENITNWNDIYLEYKQNEMYDYQSYQEYLKNNYFYPTKKK